MNQKLFFVVNPHAGKSEIRGKFLEIIQLFVSYGYEVTVHTTSRPMEIPTLIAQRASQYDLVVCSGGDGTLNETISGLMRCSAPPLLGYIPSGTVNDFASSLGIPKNMMEAAQLIAAGSPFACDIGAFHDRYFSYIAAFGAFTEVSYQTPQQAKNVLGRVAYLLEGVRRITEIRPYHLTVEYDGQTLEDDFIFGMVSNSTSVGGFSLGSQMKVSMCDGLLEVLLLRIPKSLLDLQRTVNGLLFQEEKHPTDVITFKTSSLRVTCSEPLSWTLDGEFGGSLKCVEIRDCPRALKILVPDIQIFPQQHLPCVENPNPPAPQPQ